MTRFLIIINSVDFKEMEPLPNMFGGGGAESFGFNAPFDHNKCLEELRSGDEMRIYSAILELSRTLSLAQENTLTNFSKDTKKMLEAIINIFSMPTYSDISNETAFH